MRGLMVVNAFLRSTKFTDVYETLRQSAQARGIALSVVTNAEVCFAVQAPSALAGFDFVLFWDKDVQLASQLEQLGLPVFNSAESILRCDDKALTWLCLRKSELRMPKTILLPKTFPAVGYPSLDFLDGTEAALGFPVVLKECFGSFGQQVYLLDTLEALKQKVQSLAGTPMLMQELVRESYGRDARINVVGGRVVASMLRTGQNGDFRSNITSGGTMEAYT
ncbi:MAG: RimK family alpha-L-glutamate ligase, partial [Clostridia bacterium]|nr:RimK family alpha-L-glutamate ligase [Clostridia bacterium]